MRYYDIQIRRPGSNDLVRPASLARLNLPSTFTSVVNGKNLPGALQVELSLLTYNYHSFEQGSYVRIWGVGLSEISQSNNLNGFPIIVKAGMSKGLPLAKPEQAGIVAQGKIFQAYGNWVGTDQTLELQLQPDTGTANAPKNYSMTWPKNTPLAQAIETTLAVALPDHTVTVAISPDLKMAAAQWGVWGKLEDFAKAIYNITTQQQFKGIAPLSGGPYPGVRITVKGKNVIVYDGTRNYSDNSAANPIKIKFEDLIGQPTWIEGNTLNFKTVMRADISVGSYVQLPPGLTSPYVLTTPGAALPGTPSRNRLTFTGTFRVTRMQHFGHSRQPDAASWCTVMNASFIQGSQDPTNPAQLGGA